MSRHYDNWGKLVGAVLRKEQFRKLAMSESMDLSIISDGSYSSGEEEQSKSRSRGNQANCDGAISVGPWGGPGGKKWSFKSKDGITKIVITHGTAVGSLIFHSSHVFGGPRYASKTDKIYIEYPSEYLTGITGTYDWFSNPSTPKVIKSLCFYTNTTKYGIFGSDTGTPFSFPMEGGQIIGFHGRSGSLIDAIGVYVKPNIFSICKPNLVSEYAQSEELIDVIKDAVPRDPGPWGGSNGKQWDDGVFTAVKQIDFHYDKSMNVIHSIQFKYRRRDGTSVWMPKHGGDGGDTMEKINIDYDDEFLVGVAGFYGPVENNDGLDVVRSLTFYTNKRKYGPFGNENGTYFTSISSRGEVVGFHGSNGTYLNAIGVHVEYV
ncbi:hypothetical protein RD792_017570 [Penstemon davidsonii]|uniref:Jacalin-type lectin domain-containing protein n=1 Tax=Penstemon davidsonii TaxID=160366 RepID=A0ABR0CP72_9LAMI|nr:hypothetical protein RD792_017570 [Penstemon davidsonii]